MSSTSFACLAIVAVLGGAAASASVSGGGSLPLRPLGGGLWTVAVDARPDDADAGPQWHFLVDTGSTHTVLAEAAARRAGLPVAPGRRLLTPAGLIEVGETRLPAFRLGDRVRREVTVLVADLSTLGRDPRIDGILGMDVLDADRIVLDLAAGALSLLDGDGDAPSRRDPALPLRLIGGRPVVEARVDGRSRSLVLDTGAAVTVLYDDAAPGAATLLGTAGGATAGRTTRAEMSVGSVHLGAVPAVRMRTAHAPAAGEGLLPGGVFSRIDIDRRRGVVRVVPRR